MTTESEFGAAKAQLLDDFGKVVADTEALLRALANVSGDKAVEMRRTVEMNLDAAKARLSEIQGVAVDKATGAAREADAYVREKPWTAIGIAAAVGVIVGVMIASNRR